MKKEILFTIGSVLLLAIVLFAAGGFFTSYAVWKSTSTVLSKNIVAAADDTTNVFELTKDEKLGYSDAFCDSLSLQFIGTEGANTDSLKYRFYIDYSMNKTNWVARSTKIDSLVSTRSTTGATVTSITKIRPILARYARIRADGMAASGDTSKVQVIIAKKY